MPEPTNATETNVATIAEPVRDDKRHEEEAHQKTIETMQSVFNVMQNGFSGMQATLKPVTEALVALQQSQATQHQAMTDLKSVMAQCQVLSERLERLEKAEETRTSNQSRDLTELKESVEELKKRQDSHSSKIAVGEWIGRNVGGVIIKVIGAVGALAAVAVAGIATWLALR